MDNQAISIKLRAGGTIGTLDYDPQTQSVTCVGLGNAVDAAVEKFFSTPRPFRVPVGPGLDEDEVRDLPATTDSSYMLQALSQLANAEQGGGARPLWKTLLRA